MTRTGHVIAGCGVLAMWWRFGSPPPDVLSLAGGLAALTIPDDLEFLYNGKRLIPHRTITHWWALWAALFFGTSAFGAPPVAQAILKGVAFGALTHIGLDAFSPTGVPILLPTGKYRRSAAILYRTGTPAEWLFIVAIWLLVVFLFVTEGTNWQSIWQTLSISLWRGAKA